MLFLHDWGRKGGKGGGIQGKHYDNGYFYIQQIYTNI